MSIFTICVALPILSDKNLFRVFVKNLIKVASSVYKALQRYVPC